MIDEIIFRDSVQKPECSHEETTRKFSRPVYGIEFQDATSVAVTHLESLDTRYYPLYIVSSWTES